MKKSMWLPATVAPLVIVGAVAVPVLANASDGPSAGRTPTAAEVITSIADARDVSFTGQLRQRAELGLPALPADLAGSSAGDLLTDAFGLASGTTTAQVEADGADRVRMTSGAGDQAREVVRVAHDVYAIDRGRGRVAHTVLPSASRATGAMSMQGAIGAIAVEAISSDTTTTAPKASEVAGHAAWHVELTPRSSDTLVGSVALDVDQRTGLPLRVVVSAASEDEPVLEAAFTSLTYGAPDADAFAHPVPAGATVTTKDLSGVEVSTDGDETHIGAATVTGSGWDAVVEVPADEVATLGLDADTAALLTFVTKPVDGGRVLETPLVSVYLADDGRVLAGAVPSDTLVAAAR